MKTIQLQIDDKNYDSFMVIINNLKKGFVKNFTVNSDKDINAVSDKEHKYYETLLDNMSDDDKIISSQEIVNDIDFRGAVYK